MPPDPERGARVVDLFAGDKSGQNHGAHKVLQLVQRNDKGAIMATLANAMVMLAHDPALASMLAYNEFTSQPLLMSAPPPPEDDVPPLPGPYPRSWGAEDVSLMLAFVQRIWCSRMTRQTVEDAMLAVATRRRFHPVRDWLGSLKYDGHARLDRWLYKAFGAPADDYHAAVGAKMLIAAVRRVRQPGCKFDHMPVLEGPQGIGKSTAVRTLFSAEWHSDSMPPNLAERDAAMALLGVWCLELAEIEHLIRMEVETIKAFLSRAVDRYRPPYGKTFIDRPRQGILIGTTNSDDYLRDASGNRRIWPIRCQHADVEWVKDHREQLWAEAAAREAGGESLWLDDTDARTAAAQAQQERMGEDAWVDPIREWLGLKAEVTMAEIMHGALSLTKDRQDKRAQMRVAAILQCDGWRRQLVRRGGKPQRIWVRAE